MAEESIEALRSRSPGDDPEDPYEDVDLEELPDWWRRAVEEFREHDLRPYRPPRFRDGTLVHEVVEPLEAEFGVTIDFANLAGAHQEQWSVRLDGEPVGKIPRRRSPEGYTVYETEPGTLESIVRDAIADRPE